MITYEAIRKLQIEQENTKKLTKLPDDFFSQVRGYIEKKGKMKDKGDVWELDSAKRVLAHLLEKREANIMNMALFYVRSGIVPENLAREEQGFFNVLVDSIKTFHRERRNAVEGGEDSIKMVAILEEVPEFVGTNMKTYGPLKEGDIATLPEDAAVFLINSRKAREIDVK